MQISAESASGVKAFVLEGVELASLAIELVAVAIIIFSILYGLFQYLVRSLPRGEVSEGYRLLRDRLGRGLLLGLEVLVAADIVRTVILDANLRSVAVLGLLVLIRTFLSWSVAVEIDGTWPWQTRRPPPSPPSKEKE